MKKEYIFKSKRLGFRDWIDDDLDEFSKLNSDINVMEHFPKPLTKEETYDFIQRLKKHFKEKGFNYFATEILETGEFIGFIGLAYQDYESEFTPNVDIGWRLKKEAWGNGYATEGAKRCIDFGFENLNLDKIISVCTEKNFNSENVMKKIGMKKVGEFNHPKLNEYPKLMKCLCYEINKKVS